MFFTTKDRIPKDSKITYANSICNICPQKSETHRVRLTAGGDKLDYPGDPSSPEVSLLNVKIHINNTISRAKNNARYMCIDIKLVSGLKFMKQAHLNTSYVVDAFVVFGDASSVI